MEGGTRGSPRDPMEGLLEMGGNLWEPKGAHGRGPLGASGFPCEVTLGNPGDRPVGGSPRDRIGGQPCSWPWPTPPPGHGLSENANEIAENTH